MDEVEPVGEALTREEVVEDPVATEESTPAAKEETHANDGETEARGRKREHPGNNDGKPKGDDKGKGKGKDMWGKDPWGGKDAWGKDPWGKDPWGKGKDMWGKDPWGKDPWGKGKDPWGKDGWGKDWGKGGDEGSEEPDAKKHKGPQVTTKAEAELTHLRLFVTGFPADITEDQMASYFGKYGPVNHVEIRRTSASPIGFVVYKNPCDADCCVIDDDNRPGGWNVSYAKHEWVSSVQFNDPMKDPNNKPEGADPLKVFVAGMGFGDSEEEIGDYFSQWGLVTMIQKAKTSSNTGKDKGFGFVFYATEIAVQRALSEPSKPIFKNKKLDVRWRINKNERELMSDAEVADLRKRAVKRHFHKIATLAAGAEPPPYMGGPKGKGPGMEGPGMDMKGAMMGGKFDGKGKDMGKDPWGKGKDPWGEKGYDGKGPGKGFEKGYDGKGKDPWGKGKDPWGGPPQVDPHAEAARLAKEREEYEAKRAMYVRAMLDRERATRDPYEDALRARRADVYGRDPYAGREAASSGQMGAREAYEQYVRQRMSDRGGGGGDDSYGRERGSERESAPAPRDSNTTSARDAYEAYMRMREPRAASGSDSRDDRYADSSRDRDSRRMSTEEYDAALRARSDRRGSDEDAYAAYRKAAAR